MAKSRKKFKTEIRQLLDLVIHSLYTNRDIFLRELISNASDAIDRARFESLSDSTILEDDPEWKIKLHVDKEAKTITVSDNGVGMTAEEVEKNIGTIASSGTRRFLEQCQEQEEGAGPPEFIGQFGVGFYSAFMVADRVTLVTRPAGDKEAGTHWASAGTGGYTAEVVSKEGRGTDVILHVKEGCEEYLEEWKIRKIVKTYSDFVEHPIAMDVPEDASKEDSPLKEETLNSRQAIWARAKSDVTEDEYKEFYRHVSHDFQDPLETIHWNVEGTTEFRALVYIPQKAVFDHFMPDNRHHGIQLYARKVFITDNCEALLPQYLRFLRGVVESSDLPLNVSRETLQEDRLIRVIQSNVVRKVLDALSDMRTKNREKYAEFWGEFGRILKEGVHLDFGNREKLQELLLFESAATEAGAFVSLEEYAAQMPDDQKEIYYIIGDDRAGIERSPHLEAVRGRGFNVLLMTDPIDEWVVQSLGAYDEKTLKDIARGDIELGETDGETPPDQEQAQEDLKPLVEAVKTALGDRVQDVRLSRRLTESACCIVADEHGLGTQMEKILKAMHQDVPPAKRILEINPAHPLICAMGRLLDADAQHAKLAEYAELLHDQALLTAGLPLTDPVRFSQRLSDLMAHDAERLAPADEEGEE